MFPINPIPISLRTITTALILSLIWCSPLAPTHLLVVRVGPCYDSPPTSISVAEMTLTRDLYDSTLSGYMNLSKDIDNGWIVKATMQKCHDIRNLDTCDHFKSLSVIRSGCTDDDTEDEDLYSMFFHYVQPRLSCPLQAGNYKISNYPFFTEGSDLTAAESKISTSVFGYTYRLEGYDVNYTKILCVEAYLQLLYVREHSWVRGSGKNNPTTAAPESTDYGSDIKVNESAE